MRGFVLALFLFGCIPTPLSAHCKDELDECLKLCSGAEVPTAAPQTEHDQRSVCEQDCHDRARRCN